MAGEGRAVGEKVVITGNGEGYRGKNNDFIVPISGRWNRVEIRKR